MPLAPIPGVSRGDGPLDIFHVHSHVDDNTDTIANYVTWASQQLVMRGLPILTARTKSGLGTVDSNSIPAFFQKKAFLS